MTNISRLRTASLLSLLAWVSALACTDSGTGATGGTTAGGLGGGVTLSGGRTNGGASPTGGTAAGDGATAGILTGGSNTGGAAGGTGGGAAGDGPVGGGGDTEGGGGGVGDPTVLTVQLQEVRQIIRGFGVGASFVPSADTLPWQQLFTLEGERALGLSILRIEMDHQGGHQSVPSDWETVKTLGVRIIGTCRSAPASWKTNDSVTGGGHLKPEYYDDWAMMIAQYANDHGLYAMSVGNDTDFASCSWSGAGAPCNPPLTDEFDSMVYTGNELAAFVANAGPIFKEKAPNTKMIAPEASSWIHVWSNLSPTGKGVQGGGYDSPDPLDCGCFSNTIDAAVAEVCAAQCIPVAAGELAQEGYDYGHWLAQDPAAWSAFEIMGVHEYESQVAYPWPADVTEGVRTKEVWQTEVSGVMYWPEQGPSKDIRNGVAVARWIHSALTVGEASAWLYRAYHSPFLDDNEGLALIKSDADSATPAKRYFAMGNFSRYIRPDVFHAVRVAGPSPDKVMVSAYKGDAGEVVIVAINETDAAANVPIAISGGTAPAMMVPYVTSETDNWKQGYPVAVAGGSLPAALPAMSVTTFVSQ
jgi:O-glycosyl hydrolase